MHAIGLLDTAHIFRRCDQPHHVGAAQNKFYDFANYPLRSPCVVPDWNRMMTARRAAQAPAGGVFDRGSLKSIRICACGSALRPAAPLLSGRRLNVVCYCERIALRRFHIGGTRISRHVARISDVPFRLSVGAVARRLWREGLREVTMVQLSTDRHCAAPTLSFK